MKTQTFFAPLAFVLLLATCGATQALHPPASTSPPADVTPAPGTVPALDTAEAPDTIKARSLQLVDSQGRVRGEFAITGSNDDVGLTIYDSAGVQRVMLSLRDRERESGLTVINRKGKGLAQIFIDDLGPVVELFDGERVVHRKP